MRFVGLFLVLCSLPVFYELLRTNPRYRRYAWFGVGILPFTMGWANLDAAVISYVQWPGHTKGLIISILDSLALALLLTTRDRSNVQPLFYLFLAYIFACCFTMLFSGLSQPGAFYVWQIVRMVIIFLAVSRIAIKPEARDYVLAGLAAGAVFQAVMSIDQRLQGVTQASGTMGHRNLLGMCMHFAMFPSLALLLARGFKRSAVLGLAGSAITIVLGGSRATLGLAGVGVILLLVLSMIRRPTARKTTAAVAVLVGLAVATPIALTTLQARFLETPTEDVGGYDERAAFERAAWAMWRDNPMGVGPNQYVLKSNAGRYAENAGVAWSFGSRTAHVHNTYLLVLAETGVVGLVTFVTLLGGVLLLGFRLAWTRRSDPTGDIALGLFMAVFIASVHCLYEWVFVVSFPEHLFAICAGLLAGIYKERKIAAADQRRARRIMQSVDPEDLIASAPAGAGAGRLAPTQR